MCAGFKAGTGNAHRLLNETHIPVTYLEIGDWTGGQAHEEVAGNEKGIASRAAPHATITKASPTLASLTSAHRKASANLLAP